MKKGLRAHIDDIHRNFTMGFMTKELAIHNFEHVLKNFGYIPRDEELDPHMADDEFLTLIAQAMGLPADARSSRDPQISDHNMQGMCPVCGKQKEVFSSIQTETMRVLPVQPPRCQECMWEWVEMNITNPYTPDTKMRAMTQEDWNFFRQYEDQMKSGIK